MCRSALGVTSSSGQEAGGPSAVRAMMAIHHPTAELTERILYTPLSTANSLLQTSEKKSERSYTVFSADSLIFEHVFLFFPRIPSQGRQVGAQVYCAECSLPTGTAT